MVTETSLDYKPIRFNDLMKTNYMPEYYKVTASTRLAKGAKDWVDLMKAFEGGVYNS